MKTKLLFIFLIFFGFGVPAFAVKELRCKVFVDVHGSVTEADILLRIPQTFGNYLGSKEIDFEGVKVSVIYRGFILENGERSESNLEMRMGNMVLAVNDVNVNESWTYNLFKSFDLEIPSLKCSFFDVSLSSRQSQEDHNRYWSTYDWAS